MDRDSIPLSLWIINIGYITPVEINCIIRAGRKRGEEKIDLQYSLDVNITESNNII